MNAYKSPETLFTTNFKNRIHEFMFYGFYSYRLVIIAVSTFTQNFYIGVPLSPSSIVWYLTRYGDLFGCESHCGPGAK